jgi:hypothetical protein
MVAKKRLHQLMPKQANGDCVAMKMMIAKYIQMGT